jgi:flagellin-like protein
MEKGISTIIATVILVVITIGLLSTAYVYFQSFARVGAIVSAMGPAPRCSLSGSTYNITIYIKNEGTEKLTSIDWYYDSSIKITAVDKTCETTDAGKTASCIFQNGTNSVPPNPTGTHVITAIGPKNQVDIPVTC